MVVPRSVHTFRLLSLLVVISACSSSPPSERTVLRTEDDDARAGREGALAIERDLGLLGDEALDAYVSDIGRRLLAGVENPRFDYRFDVVNEAQPNAFVLPGGFVYLSRGLLALLNDEDELACVLGHEIIHAERRHAARAQALEEHINPMLRAWRRAGRRASFSREMEREADEGGQRLCAAAGYDPMGMATLLRSFRRVERMRFGFSPRPTFLDTHPGLQERATINSARAGKLSWTRDPMAGDPRAALLREVEGLPVGQNPVSGVFVGHRFLHPVLDFQIAFPRGWRWSVTNRIVGAESPDTGAIVFVTVDQKAGDPQTRAEEWLEALDDEDLRVDESRAFRVGRLPAWRLELSAGRFLRRARGYATFISHGNLTYRVIAVAPTRAARRELRRTLTTTRSFRPLSAENRQSIRAHGLGIVTAQSDESLANLGPRTQDTWTPAERALWNGLFSNHVFEGGELVKISHAVEFEPGVETDAPSVEGPGQ